ERSPEAGQPWSEAHLRRLRALPRRREAARVDRRRALRDAFAERPTSADFDQPDTAYRELPRNTHTRPPVVFSVGCRLLEFRRRRARPFIRLERTRARADCAEPP